MHILIRAATKLDLYPILHILSGLEIQFLNEHILLHIDITNSCNYLVLYMMSNMIIFLFLFSKTDPRHYNSIDSSIFVILYQLWVAYNAFILIVFFCEGQQHYKSMLTHKIFYFLILWLLIFLH